MLKLHITYTIMTVDTIWVYSTSVSCLSCAECVSVDENHEYVNRASIKAKDFYQM